MNTIHQRIIKARKQFGPMTKDGRNPHFGNRYTTLETLLKAIEPALESNGVHIFNMVTDGNLRTILMAEDGSEMHSDFPLPQNGDPQKVAAAISYARRYNLSAMLNLRDDDDDGETANGRGRSQSQKPKQSHTPNGNGSAIASLMAESDRLMQQLGWDAQQGGAALGRIFPGRKSRRELTPGEFQKFNQILSREVAESGVGGN